MKKIFLTALSLVLLSGTYYIAHTDNLIKVAQMRQGPGNMMNQQTQNTSNITEDQAKTIIQNYINQNPSFNFQVLGYASFTTPRGDSSYVFELQSNQAKYMIYINPNGFTLGPSAVKNY
jgi:hypothetical protein